LLIRWREQHENSRTGTAKLVLFAATGFLVTRCASWASIARHQKTARYSCGANIATIGSYRPVSGVAADEPSSR
jgi:hypothetical protein